MYTVQLIAASTTGTPTLATYGPLIAAVASVAAVAVSLLRRRDQRESETEAGLDQRTNTAIKGLSDAYDRVEQQRAHEQAEREKAEQRAEAAERQVEEYVETIAAQREEIARLKRRRRT